MDFDYDIYDINNYDYSLPEELIAQYPVKKRDNSKLLVLDKKSGNFIDEPYFYNIEKYLQKGDVLVRNNTKVIPARLIGIKESTNAKVEFLLLHEEEKDTYLVLVGNAKVVKENTRIFFNGDKLIGTCLKVLDEGLRIIKFEYKGIFLEVLNEIGIVPLPPYIYKQVEDKNRYQTTYAKINGSAAAPTAGFHFTNELTKKLIDKGVEIVDITLHIGLGTFRPVKVNDIRKHDMHFEYYQISQEAADKLNKAKKERRRIIAVGTTSTRTLESVLLKYDEFKSCSDKTNLFIYPGFKFKAIDGLITNFHLPKSTLLMLISAFSNRDNILKAYKHAVENKYRFFSFGDAMLII